MLHTIQIDYVIPILSPWWTKHLPPSHTIWLILSCETHFKYSATENETQFTDRILGEHDYRGCSSHPTHSRRKYRHYINQLLRITTYGSRPSGFVNSNCAWGQWLVSRGGYCIAYIRYCAVLKRRSRGGWWGWSSTLSSPSTPWYATASHCT